MLCGNCSSPVFCALPAAGPLQLSRALVTLLLSFSESQAGALSSSCVLVRHASLPLLLIIVLCYRLDGRASSHLFGRMELASCTCSPGTGIVWTLLKLGLGQQLYNNQRPSAGSSAGFASGLPACVFSARRVIAPAQTWQPAAACLCPVRLQRAVLCLSPIRLQLVVLHCRASFFMRFRS